MSEITENVLKQLDIAKKSFDRSTYLDCLVRIADHVNDRSDMIHEEIRQEHHEDRDV